VSFEIIFAVPYDEVDQDSALVEMFGQVGAFKCKIVVAIGALAGLTVSMFGSMFPMPRIVYAMAKDGLIFRYKIFKQAEAKKTTHLTFFFPQRSGSSASFHRHPGACYIVFRFGGISCGPFYSARSPCRNDVYW
jgi:hypothetical protein